VPEGDTIFRTATTLRRWLADREVTAARTQVPGLDISRVVGASVTTVESRGKHLLIRFSSGQTLHTHMRMSGAWHVYPRGERWRKPDRQARLVLEAGDRLAVCFNAPVIELLAGGAEPAHPVLATLGQDLLGAEPLDLAAVRARGRLLATPGQTVGELLLDQRVVAGIGNIYRCESLFLCGIEPHTAVVALPDRDIDRLVTTAARLLTASAITARPDPAARGFQATSNRPWVYGRSGLPCRRCGSLILSARLGQQARTVYWCPTCQPAS
jgi:endonuclease-8